MNRKGFLYTITTVLLLISLVYFMEDVALRSSDKREQLFTLFLGNKITYVWEDVDEDIRALIGVNITKYKDNVTFLDHLPGENLGDFLQHYGEFLKEYYVTPDLQVRFFYPDGIEIDLADMMDKIIIMPMGIQYWYPNYGKNRLFIDFKEKDPANFSAIDYLYVYIKMYSAIWTCDPYEPGDCDSWTGKKPITKSKCDQIKEAGGYCLRLNLSIEDSNGDVVTYGQHYFDIAHQSQSKPGIEDLGGAGDAFIRIQLGALTSGPKEMINIELHKITADSKITLDLNTSDFWLEYPAKILINSTDFEVHKYDWI